MKIPSIIEVPDVKAKRTREILALQRTKLANERTLLAYIRGSLYMFLGGIAVTQIQDFSNIKWIGFTSIGLSFGFLVLGIIRFVLLKQKLRKWNKIMHLDVEV